MKFVKTILCRMLCRKHRGAALILSMIFILIFSVLAVSIASLADTNVQIANNQHKTNCARACAESGLEIIRLWLNNVSIPGDTAPSQIFTQVAASFQSVAGGISGITTSYDTSSVIVPNVTLDSTKGQGFNAQITQLDAETIQVDVTGTYGSITRTIRVYYKFTTRAHNVFDYGVATKGPLSLAGNIELEGANVSVEASVYIESGNSNLALSIIGNSQIAGDTVHPILTTPLF